MYNELPIERMNPYEALQVAKEKGWIPILTVLAKLGQNEEGFTVNIEHLHFLYGVDDGTAMQVALQCVADLHMAMRERSMRRAREN